MMEPEPSNSIETLNTLPNNDTDRIKCSLHVADLDPRVTEEQLESYFSTAAGLKAVKIPRDRASGVSLGYAYLTFETDEEALETLESHAYLSGPFGRPLRITATRQSVRKDLRVSGCNIYVKNLGPSIDCRDLYIHFKPYGNVVSVRIATETSGESKGYGFVCYDSASDATIAVEKLNESELKESKLHVSLAIQKDREIGMAKLGNSLKGLSLGGNPSFPHVSSPGVVPPEAQPHMYWAPTPPIYFVPVSIPPKTPAIHPSYSFPPADVSSDVGQHSSLGPAVPHVPPFYGHPYMFVPYMAGLSGIPFPIHQVPPTTLSHQVDQFLVPPSSHRRRRSGRRRRARSGEILRDGAQEATQITEEKESEESSDSTID